MTEQQFQKAKEFHERLEQLEEVKASISNNEYNRTRLSYLYEGIGGKWEIVDNKTMSHISDILDRHDKQIRQEINEEIEKLKKEIEAL